MHRDAGKPCVTQADNMETPAYGLRAMCFAQRSCMTRKHRWKFMLQRMSNSVDGNMETCRSPMLTQSQTEPVPGLQVAASDVAMLQSDTQGIQVCKCAALTAAGMSQQGPSLTTASLQPSGDPFFWNRAWPQSCLYKGWLHWMRIAFPCSHSRSSAASCASSVVQTLDVTMRATFQTQMR